VPDPQPKPPEFTICPDCPHAMNVHGISGPGYDPCRCCDAQPQPNAAGGES